MDEYHNAISSNPPFFFPPLTKLRVMPNNVFMKRDPIVCGVVVEAGVVKTGTPICVPSKDVSNLNQKYRATHRVASNIPLTLM